MEIARFDICLYPNNQSYFGSHKANLPTGVDLVCYEGNTAELLDVTQLGPIINYTCEDLYNHPAYYDLTWCFGVACQVGNPLVANSGAGLICISGGWQNQGVTELHGSQFSSIYQTSIGGGEGWHGGGGNFRINQSHYAPNNVGTSNKFFTPQGGPAGADASHSQGYAQNNSNPGSAALVDWNAAASSPSVTYALSGPTSGYVGNAAAYAITPNSVTTDTITFSDGGAGGTFGPTSLTFTASSATQTFSYTPASVGTKTLTVTSADGGPIIGGACFAACIACELHANRPRGWLRWICDRLRSDSVWNSQRHDYVQRWRRRNFLPVESADHKLGSCSNLRLCSRLEWDKNSDAHKF